MHKILPILLFSIVITPLFSQNPGNVGTSNLTAWFKADALAPGGLSAWTTTFPTGGSAITLTELSPPYPEVTDTPTGAVTNYNKTIDFIGNSVSSLRALENPNNLNLLDNTFSGGKGTFFAVYYLPATAVCSGCHVVNYREGTSGTVDGIQFRVKLGSGVGRIAIGSGNSSNASRDWTQDFKPDVISYVGNKSGLNTMKSYQKSLLFTGGVPSATTGTQGLYFGTRKFGTSSYNAPFDGFLSEVIFYNTDLSILEYNKVHTYLGIKYGLTHDNTGGGTQGDYVSTDGTITWDASDQPVYHNDIIGITREDTEGLFQKQSHTFGDTTRLYTGTLMATNSSNTSTPASYGSDRAYVMMGQNNGDICSTTAANNEAPAGIFSRLEREWKVTNTSFTGSFNWDVTLHFCAIPSFVSPSDIRLLVDDDGDFTDATIYDAGGGLSFSFSGGAIVISGVSNAQVPVNSTMYLTIASTNQNTPLPIELLSFEAKAVDNKAVELNWQTANEVNADYFSIERFTDASGWAEISKVNAIGEEGEITGYEMLDEAPLPGISYYRLRQNDFDGSFSYSEIRSVMINRFDGSPIMVFPNPVNDLLTIIGTDRELEEFRLYNILGQEVTNQTKLVERGNSNLSIDVSALSSGLYVVNARTGSAMVFKD